MFLFWDVRSRLVSVLADSGKWRDPFRVLGRNLSLGSSFSEAEREREFHKTYLKGLKKNLLRWNGGSKKRRTSIDSVSDSLKIIIILNFFDKI